MDQEKLTAEIARRVVYSGREVDIVLNAFIEVVSEAFQRGEHVKLTNLGRFVVVNPGPVPKKPAQTRQKRKKTVEFVLSKRFIFPSSENINVPSKDKENEK